MRPICTRPLCTNVVRCRGLCSRHYDQWLHSAHGMANKQDDNWVNPLVCTCDVPLADPRYHWGECQRCFRKPLALFGVTP